MTENRDSTCDPNTPGPAEIDGPVVGSEAEIDGHTRVDDEFGK